MTTLGSITDVAGVLVGHHQRAGRGWQTGTTVVLVPDGATPGVDVRGGGPGTRETDALRPENLVDTVHAICLTGGSAFGLSAADGVMEVLEARGLGVPIGGDTPGTVPVVPTAVIFDLGRGGDFGHRPDPMFGRRAVSGARRQQQRWGSVGAGTGALAGGLQGGVGTASTVVELGDGRAGADEPRTITVGATAVVNSNGSPVDPSTGRLWHHPASLLHPPSRADARRIRDLLENESATESPRLNTTIGVVATSATLTKAETSKLAAVAHDGLARAIRPAHSMFDGDTVFALATGADELGSDSTVIREQGSRHHELNLVLAAAADTFAAACAHAIASATAIGSAPAYVDVCPTTARSG